MIVHQLSVYESARVELAQRRVVFVMREVDPLNIVVVIAAVYQVVQFGAVIVAGGVEKAPYSVGLFA